MERTIVEYAEMEGVVALVFVQWRQKGSCQY